jgi:predicted metalloprotease with PDZ domain
MGLSLKSKNGIPEVEKVEFGSPAQKAGISTGDMVIAIAGIRVTAESFNERLRDFAAGDAISVTIFHQDLLHTVEVTLQEPVCNQFELVQIDNASPNQELNLRLWLSI